MTDVDECKAMPMVCKNGHCMNTMGSFRCICDTGFKVDHTGTHCLGKQAYKYRSQIKYQLLSKVIDRYAIIPPM